MKKVTKVLTKNSNLDVRDLVSITLSLYYTHFSDCLYIDEFVPNMGFAPKVPFDELSYGSIHKPSKLNTEALFEDFRNILQLESLHVFSENGETHLAIEDGAIYSLKTDSDFLIRTIDMLVV